MYFSFVLFCFCLPGGATVVDLFNLPYFNCLTCNTSLNIDLVVSSTLDNQLDFNAWSNHKKYNSKAALLFCQPLAVHCKIHCSWAWCLDHWREHLRRLPSYRFSLYSQQCHIPGADALQLPNSAQSQFLFFVYWWVSLLFFIPTHPASSQPRKNLLLQPHYQCISMGASSGRWARRAGQGD